MSLSSSVFGSDEQSSDSEKMAGAKKPKAKAKKSPDRKKKAKGSKKAAPVEEEKPSHPDDILPLLLTSVTQELFSCIADEHVTGESPYKLLKKDDIVQDMKTRAAVSDFSPAKQIVLEYPDEELLLVYDRTFAYGQCFYLVLTPEAKDRLLKPPSPEVLEDEEKKPSGPRQWIGLGSEREIEEESVRETRKKLRYTFSRQRRKFGLPVCFSDRSAADAEADCVDCVSYQDSNFSIKRVQQDCPVQAIPVLRSSSAQTQWKFQKNAFTQYALEQLNDEEKEMILQSDSLKAFMNSVIPRTMKNLQQEVIMNVFLDDCKSLEDLPEYDDKTGKASKDLMIFQDFVNQKYTRDKKVSSMNWHPTIHGVIAVALAEKKKWSTTFVNKPSYILFYSFSNLFLPQLVLEGPDDILAFEFCPSDPNIIVGGCVNGQVALWDISANVAVLLAAEKKVSDDSDKFNCSKLFLGGSTEDSIPVVYYCAVSTLQSKHQGAITDIKWLPTTFKVTDTGLPVKNQLKMSVQVLTCSLDCTLKFWDIQTLKWFNESVLEGKRNDPKMQSFRQPERTWKPLFKVSLSKIDTSGEYVPLRFSLEPYTCNGEANENVHHTEAKTEPEQDTNETLEILTDVNTKLYIGTEDGEIVYTDWTQPKEESDQGTKPLHYFRVHHWRVNTVQRSPFFNNIILTVGEWSFAIWREEVMEGPIILSANSEQTYSAGCWSLSRPAVFFIGKEDGSIEVWNLLEKTNEAVHTQEHLSNAKITCMKPWSFSSRQHFLAVTDNDGLVRILEIPKTFYVRSRNENANVIKYFELEESRLKNLLKMEKLWGTEEEEEEDEVKEPHRTVLEVNKEKEEYDEFLILEKHNLMDIGLLSVAVDSEDA